MRTYRGEEKPSGGEISKTKYDIVGLSDTKYQGKHLAKVKGAIHPISVETSTTTRMM